MSDLDSWIAKLREVLKVAASPEDRLKALIKLFVILPPGKKLPTTLAERKLRLEWNMPRWNDSLKWAAQYWNKDQRTIRRWCRNGVFRNAYQTKGGHWRIPFLKESDIDLERLRACYRNPKSLFQSEYAKSLKEFFSALGDATDTAQILDLIATEVRKQSVTNGPAKVSNDALDLAVEERKRIRLEARARMLVLDRGYVTATALAMKLGISRATLYRNYGTKMVRTAIQRASRSVNCDTPATTQNSLSDEVAEVFSEAAKLFEGKAADISRDSH
jgi:hypothetical protein